MAIFALSAGFVDRGDIATAGDLATVEDLRAEVAAERRALEAG